MAAILWLPFLGVLATIATVAATGCQVDEASVHPCIVAGHEIGEVLGSVLLLAFVAAPATLLALGATVVWAILWQRRRRSASREAITEGRATLDAVAGETQHAFRTTGRQPIQAGWRAAFPDWQPADERGGDAQGLPALRDGSVCH